MVCIQHCECCGSGSNPDGGTIMIIDGKEIIVKGTIGEVFTEEEIEMGLHEDFDWDLWESENS